MWMPSIPNVRGYLATLHFTPDEADAWIARHPETPMTDVLPDHSKRGHSVLGASGAERWMNCPGSVALLRELTLPESDEPDYRREGTAMHEAAAHCLDNGLDTWEIVGQTFHDTVIEPVMANAIQVYLDTVRPDMARGTSYVEYGISSPVHPDFWGTLDHGVDTPGELIVTDLKGGEGIIVHPEENPQLKYYAFGIVDGLERQDGRVFPPEHKVRLRIVQPRAVGEEPVREWSTTVGELKEWVHDTLVPAMQRTEFDDTLEPGTWCRFCPAKLVCPMMVSLFGAAARSNPAHVVHLSDAGLDRSYQYAQAVKMYLKALEEEAFRRANEGTKMTSAKLVNKKANRVWKPTAALELILQIGEDCMTKPELKTPAQVEKIGPAAAKLVTEFAFTPVTGLTLAPVSDPRPAVKVQPEEEVFKVFLDKLQETTNG